MFTRNIQKKYDRTKDKQEESYWNKACYKCLTPVPYAQDKHAGISVTRVEKGHI